MFHPTLQERSLKIYNCRGEPSYASRDMTKEQGLYRLWKPHRRREKEIFQIATGRDDTISCEWIAVESYRENFGARVSLPHSPTRKDSVPPTLPLTRSTTSGDNEFRFSLVGQTRQIRRLGCYRLTLVALARTHRIISRERRLCEE